MKSTTRASPAVISRFNGFGIMHKHGGAIAFCHLLGTVRLMPRLKRIKYERLYLPAKGMVGEFPNLTGVLTRPIRGDLITQQYDEMVKAAVALKDGTAMAEAILRRFNSYNVAQSDLRLLPRLARPRRPSSSAII
jgi:TnpA family transposase